MAHLNTLPKAIKISDLPKSDKMDLAIKWLRENPQEIPIIVACYYSIMNKVLL